jgi:peptidoglycan/LPS O-acetylase OafA/YrhL
VWLSRLSGGRLAAWAAAIALAGSGYFVWCGYHTSTVLDWGMMLTGYPAEANGFDAWAGFYSPLGRMMEFLLGAFAAQQYMLAPKGSGIWARWPTAWTSAAAVGFLGSFAAAVISDAPVRRFIGLSTASLVALLMLLIIRHSTWISRCLSNYVIVKLGEASYSLYLLHWYILTQWVAPYANPMSLEGRFAMYLVGMAICIAISRLVFVIFERPSMRWLRANFKPLRLHLVLGVAFVIISGFSVAASLQFHAVQHFCESGPDCSALGIAHATPN